MKSMFRVSIGAVVAASTLGILISIGCQTTDPKPATPAPVGTLPKPIDSHDIHNMYQLTPRLYSGSQPEGAAFDELKKLGVTTIISVDGAAPDIEAAKARGMRYIHLPIGYDAVPEEKAMLLAKAMKETTGPVFLHCHHGKHRGPAAAGVCAIADSGWSNEEAVKWMNKAGTSPDYKGLFESVDKFKKPDDRALAKITAPLPERAKIPATAEAMVHVDAQWEHLLAARKTSFKNVPDHPDIEPAHESLQLAESFREMARTDAAKAKGDDFIKRVLQADAEAAQLHEALKKLKAEPASADHLTAANAAADLVAKGCKSCHVRYRN